MITGDQAGIIMASGYRLDKPKKDTAARQKIMHPDIIKDGEIGTKEMMMMTRATMNMVIMNMEMAKAMVMDTIRMIDKISVFYTKRLSLNGSLFFMILHQIIRLRDGFFLRICSFCFDVNTLEGDFAEFIITLQG